MPSACFIRLRPLGPWRSGPGEGGDDRVDSLFRSDRLFSAVTLAMRQLGFLDEWLEATARASQPAVTFTSLFPYQGDTAFAPPPATNWPPPPSLLKSNSPVFLSKVRWSAASFVPVSAIESILLGQPLQVEQWMLDAESGCLLRRDRPSATPFRTVSRTTAAVDRLTQSSSAAKTLACVEFEPNAGLWTLARFADGAADSAWKDRVQAAFRLLADSGFGARRTSGWGRTDTPEFEEGIWPNLLMPKLARAAAKSNTDSSLFWLLSLYSPAAADTVDWSGGDYRVTLRGGWIDNSGQAGLKKGARMIAEGSVLTAAAEPIGLAVDVAPDGFSHPVYRSGLALALQLPLLEEATDREPVEQPTSSEAVEPPPCETAEEPVTPEAAEQQAPQEVETEADVATAPVTELEIVQGDQMRDAAYREDASPMGGSLDTEPVLDGSLIEPVQPVEEDSPKEEPSDEV